MGSLFAGMGLFCKGFRDEGFRVAWANENDKFCAQTYRENFPETKLHEESIEDLFVKHQALEPVDVLTAGFPCQPFSVAGGKKGFGDKRGEVFFDIIRLLKEFGSERPKMLLFENVPHLLNHNRGRSFSRVAQHIQRAGYWFDASGKVAEGARNFRVLNTSVHTEIPQNRERLFMVAFSRQCFDTDVFAFPEPVGEGKRRYYRELLDLDRRADDYYYFEKGTRYWKPFRDAIDRGNKDNVYLLRRNYVREHTTVEVPTLMAHMGDGGHNVPVIQDRWGIRKLTPEECLKLQGVDPGSVKFPADLSRTQRYKQIGNAVTVPLVRSLAAECRRRLDGLHGSPK